MSTVATSSSTLSIKRSADHLRSWIKVHQLKQEINDVLLSECTPQIIQLFGTNDELLDFFIKYSSKYHLDAIHQILHDKLQQFKIRQKEKGNISMKLDKKLKISSNNFDIISGESIANICGFLSRDDTTYFKETSRRISIICLQEMSKCSVGICIANNLINSKHIKHFKWSAYISSYHRYNTNTTYSIIFEELQKYHHFEEIDQVPFVFDKYWNSQKINKYDTIHPKVSLIMFHKRDIIMLTSQNISNMSQTQMFDYDNNALIILFYFDVVNQEMNLVKYILIDASVTYNNLDEYIRNTLINDDNYKQMKKILNMNNTSFDHQTKLDIYPLHPHHYLTTKTPSDTIMNSNSKKISSFVFQIRVCDLPKDTKLEYETSKLTQFCHNAGAYLREDKYENTGRMCITYKCNNITKLQNQIKHYIQTQKLQVETKKITNKYCIVVDKHLKPNVIKHHLSRYMFNGIISPHNIELFSSTNTWTPLPYAISFDLVPYDTSKDVEHGKATYSIYAYSEAPFPFKTTKVSSNPTRIRIKVNKQCTLEDVMKQLIKLSNDPLFSYQFEEMKQLFDNYISSNCYILVDDYHEIPVDVRLSLFDDKYDHYKVLYQSTERITPVNNKMKSVKRMQIFTIPKQMRTAPKRNKLMVRFSWKNEFDTDEFECEWWKPWKITCLLGLPLFVWIDIDDTMQDILDSNPVLQQYKDDICSIYVVFNKNATLISNEQRNTYNLFHELCLEDDDGFIVITLNKRDNLYVDQYQLNKYSIVLAKHNESVSYPLYW